MVEGTIIGLCKVRSAGKVVVGLVAVLCVMSYNCLHHISLSHTTFTSFRTKA